MQEPVNLLTPDVRSNPYPTYARLRLGQPVQQIQPGGIWAVSRYQDAEVVLKSPHLFSSQGFEPVFRPEWLPHNPLADSLVTKDGAGHAKIRALLSKAFTPRAIARLEPRIRAIAVEVTERLAKLGEADYVTEFCGMLPGRVMADILGLDPALQAHFKRWVHHMALVSPIYPGDEIANGVRATVRDMEGYFKEILAARRQSPGDDPVSELVRAEIDGAVLSDEDIIAFLFLLLPAGFETTMHLFSTMFLDFAKNPDTFTRLRNDPSLIPAHVEEALRKEPPVHGVMRLVGADTELGGVKIPAGSMVMVLLGSANHDDSKFPDAARFDAARGSSGLAFGHGAHFCLGAALARLEVRIALEELALRFRGFEKLPGDIEWNVAFHVRGPVALPFRGFPVEQAPAA